MSELEQVKAESEGRRKVLLEKAEALREAEIKVDNLEAERDRLAAEVERLKEQILDHDCPSFSMCPKHIGSRELEECPYCTIDRLTGRWTKLRSGLAKFPAHSTKLAILLVDALEREEAK